MTPAALRRSLPVSSVLAPEPNRRRPDVLTAASNEPSRRIRPRSPRSPHGAATVLVNSRYPQSNLTVVCFGPGTLMPGRPPAHVSEPLIGDAPVQLIVGRW